MSLSEARAARHRAGDLAVAAATTGSAQLIHALYYWNAGGFGEPSFAAEHLALIAGINAGLALLLGGRAGDRPWAAAAFLLPIAGALLYGRLASRLPDAAGVLCVLVFVTVSARFLVNRLDEGRPFLLGTLGAIVGSELLGFRVDAFRGTATDPAALVRPVAVCGASLMLALLAHRLPRHFGRPGPMASLALIQIAIMASFLSDPLGFATATYRPQGADARQSPAAPIVLVVLDTVRADHLALYGYSRDTMPRLDRFSRSHCVWAKRAVANAPASLETHASMFTGLYPPRHGARKASSHAGGPYVPLHSAFNTLPETLMNAGYWTVGLSANMGPLDPSFGLSQGFSTYKADPSPLKRRSPWIGLVSRIPIPSSIEGAAWVASRISLNAVMERRADQIAKEAIAVLSQAREPLFLFVNFLDAHAPYLPPAAYLDHFPGRSSRIPLGQSHAVEDVAALLNQQRSLSPAERAHLDALYDSELGFLDSQLGLLLETLERHPRFDEMLIVILGDHGESLGEHHLLGHSLHLYGELLSIPFIVKPGKGSAPAAAGTGMDGIWQSVDVFPMVAAHAGLPARDGLDGAPWGFGRTVAFAWSYPFPEHVRSKHPRFGRPLRSVESGGMKLIANDVGRMELYDLLADPGETRDLSAQRTDELEVLERPRALGYIK